MRETTEFRTTVHAYVSAAGGAQALRPHTDPYPVLVLQVNGTKEWRLCVPTAAAASTLSSEERARQHIAEHSGGKRKYKLASFGSLVHPRKGDVGCLRTTIIIPRQRHGHCGTRL